MLNDIYLTPEQRAQQENARQAKLKADRLEAFRGRRNVKLAECDWTQMPDAQLTPEKKAAWATYRQALRDLPATVDEYGWVTWPKKPN